MSQEIKFDSCHTNKIFRFLLLSDKDISLLQYKHSLHMSHSPPLFTSRLTTAIVPTLVITNLQIMSCAEACVGASSASTIPFAGFACVGNAKFATSVDIRSSPLVRYFIVYL